uniref:polymorphic toxin-type HINT domain-containing protein n=1 Tax=Glycomyces salinus TaxID=980294 RepID=UPI0018EDEB99
TMVKTSERALVTFGVDTDGDGATDATVTATDEHPIWVADLAQVPIEDVFSTDPAETDAADTPHVSHDESADGSGSGGGGPPVATLSATTEYDNHQSAGPEEDAAVSTEPPSELPGQWVDAIDLQIGQLLRTSAGSWIQITAVDAKVETAMVHNLTVADLHTYSVTAADTNLLTHNAGGCDPAKDRPGSEASEEKLADQTLGAGEHAQEGVALIDGDIDAPPVRDMVNEAGDRFGCHTCGASTSGLPSGNWIPDHQPPTKLVSPGAPQTAYPHCARCYRSQGGLVSNLIRRSKI